MGIVPNLLNGTENVTTFGVTLRITMTLAGSVGISLEDILLLLSLDAGEDEKGLSETYPLKTPTPMAAAGNRRKAVPRGPGPLRVPERLVVVVVVVVVGMGRLYWLLFLLLLRGDEDDEKVLFAVDDGDE